MQMPPNMFTDIKLCWAKKGVQVAELKAPQPRLSFRRELLKEQLVTHRYVPRRLF
jgi:hypothetical protein